MCYNTKSDPINLKKIHLKLKEALIGHFKNSPFEISLHLLQKSLTSNLCKMIFQLPLDLDVENKNVQAIIDLDTGFIGFTESIN